MPLNLRVFGGSALTEDIDNPHRRTVDVLREKASEPWSAAWRAVEHLHDLVEDLAAARCMVEERSAPEVDPDHLTEAIRQAEPSSGT